MPAENSQQQNEQLLERFKRIQTQFHNATTNAQRQAALMEMQKLSDETTALLRAQFAEPAQT